MFYDTRPVCVGETMRHIVLINTRNNLIVIDYLCRRQLILTSQDF